MILALALLFADIGFAQTIGDFKMDETELYAMTKQMGQFMRRFNYEEDQFGNRLYPKDHDYRSNEMRRKSLPILFDQEKYGKQTELQRYFIEDVTKGDSTYMTFLGGKWYSEVSTTFKYNGKNVNVMLFWPSKRKAWARNGCSPTSISRSSTRCFRRASWPNGRSISCIP